MAIDQVIARFSQLRALVVGDVVLDGWLAGTAGRLAPEGPVPVVTVSCTEYAPGAAGNTAVNLAALGARVRLVGTVGDDGNGAALRRALRARGVDDTHLVCAHRRPTTVKHRLVADDQVIARYDSEDRTPVSSAVERELINRIERLGPSSDVVVVCDYAAGVTTPRIRQAISIVCRAAKPVLIVDAHRLAPWAAASAHAVLPNFDEVLDLLGETPPAVHPPDRAEFLAARSDELLERTGAQVVVTTLDGDGTVVHTRGGRSHRTYAKPAPHRRTAGAGDSYTSAFALAIAAGADPAIAADLGQAAAAVVVGRDGTATCSQQDLVRLIRRTAGPALTAQALAEHIGEDRRAGRRIVFTNGCFDVLHRGHIAYLDQARRLGDVLVVAVNSDASVRRLKGPDRPINRCEDRVEVLAALQWVDYVTVFDEDTPEQLLRLLRPDIYAKGGDYSPVMLPEASLVESLGGEVRILDYVADRSTTSIVERIRGPATPADASTAYRQQQSVQ